MKIEGKSILSLAAVLVIWFAANASVISPANAQSVANPVFLRDDSAYPSRDYSVTCSTATGSRGTWLRITESVVTTQLAVTDSPSQSILYCFGTDGKPGLISNAPSTMILPIGTHVVISPAIELSYKGKDNGPGWAVSFALVPNSKMYVESNGIFFLLDPHTLFEYAAQASITVNDGSAASFVRPQAIGFRLGKSVGCVVKRMDVSGKRNNSSFYPEDCRAILKKEGVKPQP